MALPVQIEKLAARSTPSPSTESSGSEQEKRPSLLTVRLLADIPVIKALIEKSEATWRAVKEGNQTAKWMLNAVEVAARTAAKPGRILGWIFRVPIDFADRAISGRITEAEKKWPIVKESPSKVAEITMEAVRGRLGSWYAASGVVAADGKRAITALTDLIRKMVSAVQTSVHQSLTNFEDLVEEIAARAAGELRIVEGHSSATSVASGAPPTRPVRPGLLKRALQSGLYLCVGGAVCALSAVPVVGRFAEALREHTGPHQGEAEAEAESRHASSRASPTSERPASSSRASVRSEAIDEEE